MNISIETSQFYFLVRLSGECFRECLDALKEYIPSRYRKYMPDESKWRISISAEWELQEWADFCRITYQARLKWESHWGEKRQKADTYPSAIRTRDDAFIALHLRPSAPPEVVKAAYKAMSLLHHPDRGGSTSTMQLINVAYETLTK